RALCPEMRKRADACRAIDGILARATALAPDQRHQDGQELGSALAPWLAETREPRNPSRRLVNSLLNMAAPGDVSSWSWTVRHPRALEGGGCVAAGVRLDDERWVICGRLQQGQGFCSIYTPTQWETMPLSTPRTRAFVSGASEPERGLALVVGSDGVALRIEG